MSKFEDYLMEVHEKDFRGDHHDLPDAFADWLVNLEADEIVEYADKYVEREKKYYV